MLNDKTISVLITTYHPKRRATLGEVVRRWLAQPVDQVWLLDNSGEAEDEVLDFTTELRFLYWNLPCNFQTRADYGVAMLTDGDLIICADDDVVPKEGFVKDLVTAHEQVGGFVGIIGRRFQGPNYYKDCPFSNSVGVDKLTRVGFVGVVYMGERHLFSFDTRGMLPNCDDLWHQMKVYTYVGKHVVPTDKYVNLPCSNDDSSMFKSGDLKRQRNAFFVEYYDKYYGSKGREV